MTPPEDSDPSVFQKFRVGHGKLLPSLLTHVCMETGRRYVFWGHMQDQFAGIKYLRDWDEKRILFMINNEGEVYRPLRIESDTNQAYNVIFDDQQRLQAKEAHYIKQGSGQPSTVTTASMDTCTRNGTYELELPTHDLFTTSEQFYWELKDSANPRQRFREFVANARLFHAFYLEKIKNQEKVGFEVTVDGKDQAQLMWKLRDLERQVPELDYRNSCFNMLHGKEVLWDFPGPRLFIVLPSDLDSWDDLNPSTHQFRLYFMCDTSRFIGEDSFFNISTQRKIWPQQVHISNHPGYNLLRPHEFFQIYGDYVLRILTMVKRGYADQSYKIPSLASSDILFTCGLKTIKHSIAKNPLHSLVDHTIAHIQQLSPPKWNSKHDLSRSQSAVIKSFLDVHDGDNAEGDLQRYTSTPLNVYWMCRQHTDELYMKTLNRLKRFVRKLGGHIDLQQGRIYVELKSSTEANQFRGHMTGINHTFVISVKLSWNATRTYVEQFSMDIAETNTVVLEIDGITPDIHPRDYVLCMTNFFAYTLLQKPSLKLVTLLNFPQPNEQCLYTGNYELKLCSLPTTPIYDWVQLRSDLIEFGDAVSEATNPVATGRKDVVNKLRSALENHGLQSVPSITISHERWNGVFCLQEGAFVEIHSSDMSFPLSAASTGSLRKLSVDLTDVESVEEVNHLVQMNRRLEELNISINRCDTLILAEQTAHLWRNSSGPLRLTFLDRTLDSRGHVIAQVVIGAQNVQSTGNEVYEIHNVVNRPPSVHGSAEDSLGDHKFLQWECDSFFSPPSDFLALFLDEATKQHPLVLTMFTLDISSLSRIGFGYVQNVFHRSKLERLDIICCIFDPDLSDDISQTLSSVQWSTLKSLVFTGNSLDQWIRIWPSAIDSQLLRFDIRGTGSAVQKLSIQLPYLFIMYSTRTH